MLIFGINISKQREIDISKLEPYFKKRNRCDLINATVLSIFGYSCSKPNCGKCINNCQAPRVIEEDQYGCLILSIYNENRMVYRLTADGCFSHIELDEITRKMDPFANMTYLWSIIIGVNILALFIVYGIYECIKQ